SRGTNIGQGPVVAAARHQRRRPHRGGDLPHLGLAGQRGLLLEALYLPAVFAVPGHHLYRRLGVRLDSVADLAVPGDHHPRHSDRIPAYLLLLPEGLLPRLLAGPRGLRGAPAPPRAHPPDPVPPGPPTPPPGP